MNAKLSTPNDERAEVLPPEKHLTTQKFMNNLCDCMQSARTVKLSDTDKVNVLAMLNLIGDRIIE